jgi:hypothetical protein
LHCLSFPSFELVYSKGQIILGCHDCFYLLQELIRLFQEYAINEITIDIGKRQVQIQFYDANRGQVTEILPFEYLQLKVNRLIWFKNGNVNSLYFFSAKKKMLEVTKTKDGFSTETINSLSNKLESLTSPVK